MATKIMRPINDIIIDQNTKYGDDWAWTGETMAILVALQNNSFCKNGNVALTYLCYIRYGTNILWFFTTLWILTFIGMYI